MGKQLMYGESAKAGWAGYHSLTERNVDEEIKDSVNNRKSKSKLPRVSVPSPFARFDLVQKAFGNVASKGNNADMRDSILVSHALDVAQLFFEIDSHPDIKIVKWNKNAAIEELKKSNVEGHVLLGKTLELYMRQENYGFNEKNYYSPNGIKFSDLTVYILTYAGDAVGCTSPTSLFMATSRYTDFQSSIKIEGDKNIFQDNRALSVRDEAFVEYLYRLIEVMKLGDDNASLGKFKDYLAQQKDIIRQNNKDLYRRINELDDYKEDDLEKDYKRTEVNVLGHILYKRRIEDMQESIPKVSDFVIKSMKSSKCPLILTNNCSYNNWRYYANNVVWNSSTHQVNYSSRERSKLPGTEVEYPWLCENDFLSDTIVMLPYPLDGHFFNGNFVGDGTHSYLLPIKSAFFEYFDFEYLKGKNGNDENFKIEEDRKKNEIISVTVTLLITVAGGKPLTLKKKYEMPDSVDEGLRYQSLIPEYALGRIVECPVALSVFPFARLKNNNYYTLQLARAGYGWDEFKVSMEAYQKAGADKNIDWDVDVERSKNTHYFSIKDSFDYLRIKIADDYRCHESVLIPEWGELKEGTSKFKFSFDFGTTNSHVSVIDMETNELKELDLNPSIVSTLDLHKLSVSKSFDELVTTLFQVLMKQEFLPDEIGKNYSFPLRTVVSVPKSINFKVTSPQALSHVNIPFIYGKEDYGTDRNRVRSNIKWSKNEEEQKFANAFIEELALLARGFAIEKEADLPECSFVWTYPLSMSVNAVNDFNEQWKEYFRKYFAPAKDREEIGESNVSKLTESIAPLLYYLDNDKALLQMTLSIDIGGGTCDVVMMRNNEDIKVASFRFAADVIFGAGKAVENPMIQTHCEYFQNLLDGKGDDIRRVKEMLLKTCKDTETESTEANSVLFSLENHPLLGKIAVEDRSYNRRLKRDDKRKIIFLYFYASIIYYLVKLLQDNGYPKPEKILFSGTGSKLLNIIGNKEGLEFLTTQFIEKFSAGSFSYADDEIAIEIERKEPKQLTAKGALCKKKSSKDIAEKFANPKKAKMNTIRYSMLYSKAGEPDVLKYADLSDETKKNQIVEEVKNFNQQFKDLSKSLKFVEEYGCDKDGMKIVERYIDKDLKAYLDTEISDNVKMKDNKEDEFEDVLFFYPIKGVIRQLVRSIK